MCYYIGDTGRYAELKLHNLAGTAIDTVRASQPGSEPLTAKGASANGLAYPLYEVLTVDGVTELIEHRRMESVFYISDDGALRAKFGAATAKH